MRCNSRTLKSDIGIENQNDQSISQANRIGEPINRANRIRPNTSATNRINNRQNTRGKPLNTIGINNNLKPDLRP